MPSTSVVSACGPSSPDFSTSETGLEPGRWDGDRFLAGLRQAVEHYDRPEVERLCALLIAHLHGRPDPYPEREARQVLRLLRRKRCFEIMSAVAEALIAGGQHSEGIRCDYAQALIDQGLPAAALDMLDRAIGAGPVGREMVEAQGLRGRAFKQMYCATGRPSMLAEAIAAYVAAYQRDPDGCAWHGINAAALIARGRRDSVATGAFPPPEQLAAPILERTEQRWSDPDEAASPWDAATAMEACLALDRQADALVWLQRYTDDRRADAFELASTHRQLLEVWRLDPASEPGATLLPILRAAILTRQEGARLELEAADLTAADFSDDAFERVLGHGGMVSHRWDRRGLTRSLAVARIEHETGRPVGTGFLVDWQALTGGPSRVVLVTNSHVLSPEPSTDDTLTPDRAVAALTGAEQDGTAVRHRIGEVVWTSPPRELDVTIAGLDGPRGSLEPCPLTSTRPRLDGKQRVYVIGHPEGRELSYSIDDNVLLDYDDRVLHYRAPTEHGSSGSPVFNRDWDVVAVHHAGRTDMPRLHGDGAYPANEGIWIEAVRRAMAPDR